MTTVNLCLMTVFLARLLNQPHNERMKPFILLLCVVNVVFNALHVFLNAKRLLESRK